MVVLLLDRPGLHACPRRRVYAPCRYRSCHLAPAMLRSALGTTDIVPGILSASKRVRRRASASRPRWSRSSARGQASFPTAPALVRRIAKASWDYAISISSAPVGLRHRQSHGGLFRQLGTSSPDTAIAFEGYSRFTPTACALLQWIARRGRTVMEDAEDRRSPDSILPREFLDGVGGTVPTREAPNARRAGRRRQRLPKVCDRVERARKTSLRRRRRVVRVDQHR